MALYVGSTISSSTKVSPTKAAAFFSYQFNSLVGRAKPCGMYSQKTNPCVRPSRYTPADATDPESELQSKSLQYGLRMEDLYDLHQPRLHHNNSQKCWRDCRVKLHPGLFVTLGEYLEESLPLKSHGTARQGVIDSICGWDALAFTCGANSRQSRKYADSDSGDDSDGIGCSYGVDRESLF